MPSFQIRRAPVSAGPSPDQVRVAAIQMDCLIGSVEENLAACAQATRLAAGEGASLVVFPEAILTGYCFSDSDEARSVSLERDGRWVRELAAVAGRNDLSVAVGYLERTPTGLANAVSLIDGTGITAHYRKTHLPHLGGDRFVEPGENRFEVYEAAGLRVGLLVCYDASFPEASRLLALGGADIILLPTNWPEEAIAKAAWLPNARAYENVTYFAAVNRIGKERGFVFHGQSRICDPTGDTLVEGPQDEPAVLLADIDPARARNKKIERREGYWVDRIGQRRPDLYRLLPADGDDA